MPEKKSAFSYSGVMKNLPFVAFVRKKTAKGSFSYDFPTPRDRDALDLSPFDAFPSDADGCPDIVQWSDKDKLARAIAKSARDMTVCTESFGVVLPSGDMRWLAGASYPKKLKDGSMEWRGFWLDVTDEKKRDYYNTIVLESVNEGVAAFDRQGRILSFSPALTRILGCKEGEVADRTIFSLLPDDVSENLQQHMLLSALKDRISLNAVIKTAEKPPVYLEIDMLQRDAVFICLFRDITAFKHKEDELRWLAYHDINTGVENYAYLKDAFERAQEKSRVEQTQIAVLSITPDSLGQLNAVTDQEISARVISAIADRIRSCLSENDCLAQTSSHHFTVLVTGLDFALSVEKKIESILHSFEQSIFVNELEFDLTVSIGVCFCPQDGETLAELISHADLALENVRANEKSAMRIYNSDLSLKAAISLNMRQNLKKAIENDEIHAYFQPQVDIGSGHIIGLEALARWRTADGVLIPPSEFIPEAEEYGLIDSLTESILDQACSWNQKWYSMGLCRVPVAVNISGRQFHNETQLLCMVDKALDNSGLPPYLLELELTESSAMFDPKNAQRIIQTLLDNNIRCALDDFGTGYSSLSVLRSFPLKKLKIDRSFVLQLNEKKNLEIVRATIAMAHALNLSVLAEGVENRQHFEKLKELGCDIIQGYLFSRPLSPEQTELMLMRWDADVAALGKGF